MVCDNPPSIRSLILRFLFRDTRPDRYGLEDGRGRERPPSDTIFESRVGEVAPVRFIPAGRLGSGPKPEAGSAGTGAKTGADVERERGRRIARCADGITS